MGFMGTITGLLNLPAPVIGGYVWSNFGSDILLLSGGLFGFLAVPLILLFIKEPEIRQA
jgi:hypothetical protein